MAVFTSLNQRNYIVVDDKIGGGTFGTIFKVKSTTSSQLFAAKCANRSTQPCCIRDSNCTCSSPTRDGEKNIQIACGVESEIAMIRQLTHPNIIHLLDIGNLATGDASRPFFIMPLALHRSTHAMSSNFRIFLGVFIVHVADALSYLHDVARVAHMDLTNNNIVIMGSSINPRFTLCDFGAARPIDPATGFGDGSRSKFADDCLTTHRYAAPELFTKKNKLVDKRSADIWSFGMCILGFCGWFRKENTKVWEKPTTQSEAYDILFNQQSYQKRLPAFAKYIKDQRICIYVCERMLRNKSVDRTSASSLLELAKSSFL